MRLFSWIRTWLSGLLFLAAVATGAWLFAQQTPSYRQMADLVRTHPAVAEQIGSVTDIKLPFFGWGIDWTDSQLVPADTAAAGRTLRGVIVDDNFFGVSAVSADGAESIVTFGGLPPAK